MTASMRSILVLIIIGSLPCLFLASLSIGDADVGTQQVLPLVFLVRCCRECCGTL